MKKIKLMLALIVMMMGGVLSANATRKIVDLSTIQSNGTTSVWDNATKTLTWNTTGGGATVQIPGLSGDLSEWETLILESENYTSLYRCVIKVNRSDGQKDYTWTMYSAGTKNLVLTGENTGFECDGQKLTKELLKSVVNVQIGGTWASSGSLKINSITLVKPTTIKFGDDGKAHFSVKDLDVTGDVSIDYENNTVTSTGTTGSFSISLPNADFSAVTRVDVTRSGDDICSTMTINDAVNGEVNTWYGSKYGADLTAEQQSKAGQVNKITWNVNAAGTMTISDIVITANVISASDSRLVDVTTLPYKLWNSDGADAEVVDNAYPLNEIGNAMGQGSTIFGDGNVYWANFVNLTGFTALKVKATAGAQIRICMNRLEDAENKGTVRVDVTKTVDSEGYATFDLTQYEFSHLHCVKFPWNGQTHTVYSIEAIDPNAETSYIISGSGLRTSSVTAALADESAKIIDATGVTGSNVSLVSANPNCIFLASEGVLANENNVCVDGIINRLFIDETKPFALPSTATAASEAVCLRQIALASNWGTVCLPYAIASNEYIQLYEVTSVESNVVNLTAIAEAAAGKPVIFKKKVADAVGIAFANESSSALSAAQTAAKLVGTYNQQVLTEGLNTKYAVSNNQFIQATSTLTVKAFRAYLETGEPAGANLRIIANDFESGETTGVQEEFMSDGTVKVIEGYYSIGGAPVTADYPGITVVKYTDGTTQTIKK